MFWNTATQECEACADGKFYDSVLRACQSCPVHQPLEINGVCYSCPAGSWYNQTTHLCYQCGVGTEYNTNTHKCEIITAPELCLGDT